QQENPSPVASLQGHTAAEHCHTPRQTPSLPDSHTQEPSWAWSPLRTLLEPQPQAQAHTISQTS
ncbi:Hypothetical predicted protein, partial [Pelobates cultripes]